jgi:hypothetical protein
VKEMKNITIYASFDNLPELPKQGSKVTIILQGEEFAGMIYHAREAL